MSTDIASLVIAIDSSQTALAAAKLKLLADAGETAETQTKKVATATDILSRAYRDLASAYGALKIGQYIQDAALLNARYETLGVVMGVVGRTVGYTASQMDAAAKALQRTGISMVESRQSTIKLVQAHIDLAESTKLARIAQDAAVVGNINSSEAFGRLVHGIQSAEVEILRGIGINVSFEAGYARTAATLHKTAAELTENEKTASRLNQVMEKGKDIAGVYEAAMDTAGKQLQSMKRYSEDAKVKIGEVFNEALTVGVMAFTDHLKDTNGELDKLSKSHDLQAWGNGAADVFVFVADAALATVSVLQTVGATTVWLGKTITDGVSRMAHPFSGDEQTETNQAYTAMVASIFDNTTRMRDALAARRGALAESAAKDIAQAKTVRGMLYGEAGYGQGMDRHAYGDTSAIAKPHAADEYTKLIAGIKEKIAVEDAEAAGVERLNAAEKFRAETYAKIDAGLLKLNPKQREELELQLDEYDVAVILAAQEKSAFNSATQIAQARAAMRKAESDGIEAHMRDQSLAYMAAEHAAVVELANEEKKLAQYGMTRSQIELINVAELELQLTRLRAYEEHEDALGNIIKIENQAYKSLQAQITARKQLGTVMQSVEDLEATKAVWVSIEQTAHTTFTNIFQGGQDAFTKLRDTLKATLLDLLYQMTVKKWIFDISASVSGQGVAQSAIGSGGNLLSTASNLKTLYGAGSQFMTGATAGSSALGMGYANAVGAVGGDSLGALITANGEWAGVATATTAAESAAASAAASEAAFYGAEAVAAGTGASAAAAGTVAGGAAAEGGMTAALGSMGPYGWVALAVIAVLAIMSSKGEYVKSTGSSVQYFDKTGAATSTGSLSNNFNTPAADAYVNGIRDSYSEAAKNLGITNNGGLFAAAFNNSDGGKFGVQVGVGSANYSTGEIKTSDEALKLEAARAVFAALQGSELPKYLQGAFDGLTASTATAEQINQVITYAQNIKGLHDQFEALPFENLKDLALSATNGLIGFAGGLDKLGASLSTYYDNFYSAEEKRTQTIANITRTLNDAGAGIDAQMVTDVLAQTGEVAKKTFRAIVDAQDVTTEAGQRNYTALLSVAGAFASVTEAAKVSTVAMNDAAEAQRANAAAWSAEGARLDAINAKHLEAVKNAQATVADLRDQATANYIAAQERVTAAQRGLADVLHGAVKSFQDVLDGLDGGRSAPESKISALRTVKELEARIRGGDTSAWGKMPAAIKAFVDLSERTSGSLVEYRRDEAYAKSLLREGIAAGNAQLKTLPVEMQQATDPVKDAYAELAKATAAEYEARVMAIAMQASLTSTEKTLGEKYLEAIAALPEADALKKFYDNVLKAAANAAKVASLAADAAAAILARISTGGATGTGGAAFVGPLPGTQTPNPTNPAGTGQVTTSLPDGSTGTTLSLGAAPEGYRAGIVGGGVYSGGTGVSITTDGLMRVDGPGGTELYWARDVAGMLNEYGAANGATAAAARAAEFGVNAAMLDQVRRYSVGLPQFDVGTNYLQHDTVLQGHAGETITPARYVDIEREARDETNRLLRRVVDENVALRGDVAKLKIELEKITGHTETSADALEGATRGTRPVKTTTV